MGNNDVTKTKRTRDVRSAEKAVADVTVGNDEHKVKIVEDATKKERIVAKEIDTSQYITVRNGFHGKLIYKSKRTGEQFVWDEFGAEQEMELHELRNAKNSYKKFFINNWFMFDEDWVIDYLGVSQFYKNSVNIEDFDNVFKESPDEIKSVIAGLPDGQKRSMAYRAKELIANKAIDSIKAITALEEALGIELIER